MRSRAEQTLSNLGPQVYAVFSAYPAVTYACAGLLAVATNCANPSWRGLSKTATALTSSLIVGHKLFQRQYKCFVLAMSVIGMDEYDGKRPENLARWLWSVHTQVVRGMVYGRCTWASKGLPTLKKRMYNRRLLTVPCGEPISVGAMTVFDLWLSDPPGERNVLGVIVR